MVILSKSKKGNNGLFVREMNVTCTVETLIQSTDLQLCYFCASANEIVIQTKGTKLYEIEKLSRFHKLEILNPFWKKYRNANASLYN